MLFETGLIFIIVGALIRGLKFDLKMRDRFEGNPFMQKISGNLGAVFFVIGIILLLAGLADLYYG